MAVSFRMNTTMDSEVKHLLKTFPFPDRSSVFRVALVTLFKLLRKARPYPSELPQIEAINTILDEEKRAADFRDIFAKMTERINFAVAQGRDGMAKSLIAKVKAQIEQMPEDSEWRKMYLDELTTRWGYRLTGDPVNILKVGDDE